MTIDRQVHIVTDSTSDLPLHLREEHGIDVVPLSISFGTETFQDQVNLTPQQFFSRLRGVKTLPTTAAPSVDAFQEAFRRGLDNGKDVVCITISAELSGTFNSARLAAEGLETDRIRVIDGKNVSMALGWISVEAARAADGGADYETVISVAENAVAHCHSYAVLDSLDYVYKGGRIGRAAHMIGSALNIKPVLSIDTITKPLERVRTWKKAVNRMIEIASTDGDLHDIAIVHTDNLAEAQKVEAAMRERFPNANIIVDWAGPTIGTYAGPAAVGIMLRTGS